MLSSLSTLRMNNSSLTEPTSRSARIRYCQELVQDLVNKPMEICLLMSQLSRSALQTPAVTSQQHAANLAERRARLESMFKEVTATIGVLRSSFVRLREIYEYIQTNETITDENELSRLVSQKIIYEQILDEKQNQLKIMIDAMRDITYQINTMLDLRNDGTTNTLMINSSAQEK